MAGYSGTPLPKKLGVKAGHAVALVNAPKEFRLPAGDLPEDVNLKQDLRGRGRVDVIVFFATRRADVERRLGALVDRLAEDGGLWIAWPKKGSEVETDLSGGAVRDLGLGAGLVDNKVCAVDETWSGHRFVRRLKDRRR